MLFAVVDIETTGSYASQNGITEIAIVIHDGTKVLDFFESLVNPKMPIPFFIKRLTGIDDDMVANAPEFREIAAHVSSLLQDKVFVAHNVNFDYSFVKYHLAAASFQLDSPKLCTVRLARKVLPGLPGYSLGKLTHYLGITHTERHRAGGDALATADLLAMIVAKDDGGAIDSMLKTKSGEQYLPPHLPVEQIESLPKTTGVYYFYNSAGKVIYVGKALNLRKRVKGHFSNNKIHRQKQDFLKEIYRVSYRECATELMAHILESAEIRKLWPVHNRSQKGYLPNYGLFAYEDQQGYIRFAVEKHRRAIQPIYTFNSLNEGLTRLKEMAKKFRLCLRMCNLAKECDCGTHQEPAEYNLAANEAQKWITETLPTFALIDEGMQEYECSCILIHNGNFAGMGYLKDRHKDTETLESLRKNIEPMQDNDFIRNLVLRHAEKHSHKCVLF
jgi:DNA polymerase III subunit epsilon